MKYLIIMYLNFGLSTNSSSIASLSPMMLLNDLPWPSLLILYLITNPGVAISYLDDV